MRSGFASRLLFLTAGFLVWALHFGFVYGLNALACARGFSGNMIGGFGVVPVVIVAATVVALLLQGLIAITAVSGRGPGIGGEPDTSVRAFWRYTTAALSALSAVSVFWTAVPVLFTQSCG
jgi:hypothetical protein